MQKTMKITFSAIVAAVYVALTILNPLSFPAVQFRVSEILVLICFYNPMYCVPMILGCLTANLFSPFGIADVVFGTLATALAVIPMYKMKNIWLASLLPVLTNAVIVGIEISVLTETPFWLNAASVGFGELVVVTVVGVPLFKYVISKNKNFISLCCFDGKIKNLRGNK